MDLHALLSKATDTMNVGRAFGSAYERGDKLIIPVAFVAGGGGGGAGEPASATQASASAATSSQGQGMGGGFGTVSWPMGVYVVTDDSVRWVPAIDVTRLAVAGLGVAKLAMRLSTRRRAGGRRSKAR